MKNKSIIQHPSIVHCSQVAEICRPLEELYNINYFAHVNVDKNGNFTALGKNPKFVEHYLESQYYNCDVHLLNGDIGEEYVIQDSVGHYGQTDKLFKDCVDFGLFHIFTIIYRNKDSVDAYHFATNKKDNKINEVYLRHLPLLKNFIAYFKDNINSNKELKNAYNFLYTINNRSASYDSDLSYLQSQININSLIEQMELKRFYIPGYKDCYLTQREMQCLLWLHYGKTAPEIEIIMGITERTVRAHIINIKRKLNCQTMYQLGEKVTKLNLVHLMDYQLKLK